MASALAARLSPGNPFAADEGHKLIYRVEILSGDVLRVDSNGESGLHLRRNLHGACRVDKTSANKRRLTVIVERIIDIEHILSHVFANLCFKFQSHAVLPPRIGSEGKFAILNQAEHHSSPASQIHGPG